MQIRQDAPKPVLTDRGVDCGQKAAQIGRQIGSQREWCGEIRKLSGQQAAGDRLGCARLIVERHIVRIAVIQAVQVGIIEPGAARVRPAHDEQNGQAEHDAGAEQSGYDGTDEEPGFWVRRVRMFRRIGEWSIRTFRARLWWIVRAGLDWSKCLDRVERERSLSHCVEIAGC